MNSGNVDLRLHLHTLAAQGIVPMKLVHRKPPDQRGIQYASGPGIFPGPPRKRGGGPQTGGRPCHSPCFESLRGLAGFAFGDGASDIKENAADAVIGAHGSEGIGHGFVGGMKRSAR